MKRSFIPAVRCASTQIIVATVVTGLLAVPAHSQQSNPEQPDNYTWLEDIYGEKQLAWVKAETAHSGHPRKKSALRALAG